MENTNRVEILGVFFDAVGMEEAVSRAQSFVESRNKAYRVHTPNAEMVEMAYEQKTQDLLNSADLILPDGIGIIKAARMLDTPIATGKVAGVEFGEKLAELCAKEGYRLFLYGARPGVAGIAKEKLSLRYPGLVVCGALDGYGDPENAAQTIKEAKADVVFVCLGMGTQEAWMRKYGEQCGASLLCGLGGSLDVYAGVAKRAPKLFLNLSLEWLWRLICQPTRLKRMLKLPKFLRNVKKEAKAVKKR